MVLRLCYYNHKRAPLVSMIICEFRTQVLFVFIENRPPPTYKSLLNKMIEFKPTAHTCTLAAPTIQSAKQPESHYHYHFQKHSNLSSYAFRICCASSMVILENNFICTTI